MSVENIHRLHNLTSREQHIHWGGRRPWEHDGGRVMLPKPANAGRADVSVDLAGNVTRMRVPVLRPCFGSPTALLVHGGDQTRSGKNGRQPTRCNACPAKEACAKVGYARLHADARIAAAYNAFEAAGGRLIFIKGRTSRGDAEIERCYGKVLAALIAHPPFANVNDAHIQAYCDDLIAERQAKDQERQRLKRDRERALRMRQAEAPEEARTSESEEGEAVHLVSLPESSSEGDRNDLALSYVRKCHHRRVPDAAHRTVLYKRWVGNERHR